MKSVPDLYSEPMEELYPQLLMRAESKIALVVLDGLGGMATTEHPTELTAAKTPNMDALARSGTTGVHTVVSPGITPGSGAGHLAIFGYDPLKYEIGRGALSAAGVGFHLKPGDVAARVNFCTIDDNGAIVDRRAGRIATDLNRELCTKILAGIRLSEDIEVFIETEREHRALLVLRGEGLSPQVSDTDPQLDGLLPLAPKALNADAERTARILADLLEQVRTILVDETANFLLLRGFDTLRDVPSFADRYLLNACGIAGYPMYIGIAKLLGMQVGAAQPSWQEEVRVLEESWAAHDFFYIHQKKTDSAGEDGDFDRKVAGIEEVDATIPAIMALEPDVICITGDHATPSKLMSHSWHPVPFLMAGSRVGVDATTDFNETSAARGGLGQVRGIDLMPLMLAAAGRLAKYGA